MATSAIPASSNKISTSCNHKSPENDLGLAKLFSQMAIKERIDCPAERSFRVLMLGEGDFSYALAYARLNPNHEIIATSYESQEAMEQRPTWRQMERNLRDCNVKILHSVDAQRLGRDRRIKGIFDRVIFNFPHTGQRDDSTARLVKQFFKSARKVLLRGGDIWMGLMDSAHYDGTYLHQPASRQAGFKLVSRKLWDGDGQLASHGYHHEETNHRREPHAATIHPGLSYHFTMADSDGSFNREDHFFHSSNLSSDDGRLKKPVDVMRPTGKGEEKIKHAHFRMRRIIEKYGSERQAKRVLEDHLERHEYNEAEKVLKLLAEAHPRSKIIWQKRLLNFEDLGLEDRVTECEDILRKIMRPAAFNAWQLQELGVH